ncbi:MAG: hypothetical protein AAFY56_15570 [Pseudomonadota bacterium]
MVASIAAGKAASSLGQASDKLASKGKAADMGDAQKMEHLLNQSNNQGAQAQSAQSQTAASVSSTSGGAGQGPGSTPSISSNAPPGSSAQPTSTQPSTQTTSLGKASQSTVQPLSAVQPPSKIAPSSMGDRILSGIDKARGQFGKMTEDVNNDGGTGATNMSDLMKMQGSMISFEVDVQAGGKSVQETNSGIQTLLKGQ